jgi:hypothetical protein
MMSDDLAELTDEFAMAQWAQMAPLIDNVVNRTQDPEDFVVEAGSQLAGDDADSDPYQVSHCARACLNAGVDHLHAAKKLILDVPIILHANADYSLLRGALENFGTAFWVLHPPQRSVRVERALRWMVKNFKDQDKATADLGLPKYVPAHVRVEEIVSMAKSAGCNIKEIRGGYASTHVLQYAEEHSMATNPYLMWQVCSGFAHGRPWASIAMNAMEITPTEVSGVSRVRFTSDHKRLLAAALPAFQLMNTVVGLFADRARA